MRCDARRCDRRLCMYACILMYLSLYLYGHGHGRGQKDVACGKDDFWVDGLISHSRMRTCFESLRPEKKFVDRLRGYISELNRIQCQLAQSTP